MSYKRLSDEANSNMKIKQRNAVIEIGEAVSL